MPSAVTIPNAAVEPTFENLLIISLQRQFPATTFSQLYKDFKSKFESTSSEKLDSTALFQHIEECHLQREYIYEVLVQSDLHNTCEEIIKLFSSTITFISVEDQKQVLLFINQFQSKFPWKLYASNSQVLNSLIIYGKYIMSNFVSSNGVLVKLVSLYSKILAHIINHLQSTKFEEEFIHFVTDLAQWAAVNNMQDLHILLHKHLSSYNLASIKSGLVTSRDTGMPKLARGNERDNSKFFRMKKLIWLAQKFTIEFVQLNDQFVLDFKSIVNLSGVSTVESMSTIITELFTGVMDCYKLSSNKVKPIWREYLINKIPLFFKFILKANQSKVEKPFRAIMTDDYRNLFKDETLLSSLEKSLAELELVQPSVLDSQKPSSANPSKQMTLDELNHNYTQKILECNPEFTSIEEIGMSTFLADIEKSVLLKNKFAELFIETVNSFIMTGDTLRLRRLLITACMSCDILDHALLYGSPYQVLASLLKFLENKVLQKPESTNMQSAQHYLNSSHQPDLMMDLDLGSDDSSNAQDFLSDLSTFVIFSRFIISRYNLLLQGAEFDTAPNSLALLKCHNVVIDHKPSSKTPVREITTDDSTMNQWIKSMFDTSNVDGISDTLIKESAPMEYAQLIPNIIHEAIICRSIGWIDDDSLMSGLEYLHQKFLICWIPFVIEEINQMRTSNKDENVVSVIDKVQKQLLTVSPNESMEVQVVIKIVRELIRDTMNQGMNTETNSKESAVEPEFHQILYNFVLCISKNDVLPAADSVGFDLSQMWTLLYSDSLMIERLYHELTLLLADQSLNSEISFELITLLLVTYSKWVVGEGISATWPKALSIINSTQSLEELSKMKLIFNKEPQDIKVVDFSVKSKDPDGNADKVDTNTESDFFGLIQEPKSEENEMDVDEVAKRKKSEPSCSLTDGIDLDVYGDDLAVLAYERKGDPVLEKLLRSILDHI
jgi:hypothetical protein